MWIYRLSGSALALCGLGILTIITHALYRQTYHDLFMLVRLGSFGVLLSTLTGALFVGFGVWLVGFWHPAHSQALTTR
jgi:hypothetical protein